MNETLIAVAELRQADPIIRASEIARLIGRTRERARQLLNELGQPTRIRKIPNFCLDCGERIEHQNVRCRSCDLAKHYQIVTCSQCNQPFYRLSGDIRAGLKRGYQHWFCNHHCFGKWAAPQWGFGTKK